MSCHVMKREALECLEVTPDPVITRGSLEEVYTAVYAQNQTEKVRKIMVDYTQSRIDMLLASCVDISVKIQKRVECPRFFIACICSADTKNQKHAYILKLLFDAAYLHNRSPVVFHIFTDRETAQRWIKNPVVTI